MRLDRIAVLPAVFWMTFGAAQAQEQGARFHLPITSALSAGLQLGVSVPIAVVGGGVQAGRAFNSQFGGRHVNPGTMRSNQTGAMPKPMGGSGNVRPVKVENLNTVIGGSRIKF